MNIIKSIITRWPKKNEPDKPFLEGRQLCFMHIGKTAGSSFFYLLRETLDNLLPFHGSPEQFDVITAKELEKYDLITGHFSFTHTIKFRPGRYLATFLRDPIERVLSSYCFLREWNGLIDETNSVSVVAAKELSLEEFLKCDEEQVKLVTNNHQSRFLADDWRRVDNISDDDLFTRALWNLNNEIDFIGLTEKYEQSIDMFFEEISVSTPSILDKKNITSKNIRISDLNKTEHSLLTELNAVDIEIYQQAKNIFIQRCEN